MTPTLLNDTIAPQQLMDAISCSCKAKGKACGGKCSCAGNGLPCTSYCLCEGGDECFNPLKQLEDNEIDDEDTEVDDEDRENERSSIDY